jgi:hypothetical protein
VDEMELCKRTYIDRPDEIDKISDLIHDCLFDLDNVKFDAEQSCLNIEFRRPDPDKVKVVGGFWILKNVELPIVQSFLNIHQVADVSINDPVRIGTYMLTDLEYSERDRTLSIICAQPLEIKVKVKALEISVEETDEIVEVKKFRSIFY